MNFPKIVEDLFAECEYDKIVQTIRSLDNLESLKLNKFLTKIFLYFQTNFRFDGICEILMILAKYKNYVYKYEIKEGIRILIAN